MNQTTIQNSQAKPPGIIKRAKNWMTKKIRGPKEPLAEGIMSAKPSENKATSTIIEKQKPVVFAVQEEAVQKVEQTPGQKTPGRLAKIKNWACEKVRGGLAKAKDWACEFMKGILMGGVRVRLRTVANLVLATQLIYSGYSFLVDTLAGNKWKVAWSNLKDSFFLDNVAKSLIKDGQIINNLDGGTLLVLALLSMPMGIKKGASSKINDLIAQKSTYNQETKEMIEEYEPTNRDKVFAYISTICGKIPKYAMVGSVIMLLFKTDIANIVSMTKQAEEALTDTLTSPLIGGTLAIAIMWKGIKMFFGNKASYD